MSFFGWHSVSALFKISLANKHYESYPTVAFTSLELHNHIIKTPLAKKVKHFPYDVHHVCYAMSPPLTDHALSEDATC